MSEDIKEKIDKSKKVHRYNIISSREWFENLLTYITNLQQENKQLIEINENKQKEIDKLVCIIYKAIEYINNTSYFDGSSMCANDLLKILGDKE